MIDEPRIGIAGLGEMGRHHARVLTRLEGIRFIGGADPAGDVHGALAGHPLFPSLEDLIEAGPDAVVLVTPAAEHEKCAIRLAEAGIHTLIEKPMANDLEASARDTECLPRWRTDWRRGPHRALQPSASEHEATARCAVSRQHILDFHKAGWSFSLEGLRDRRCS